MLRERTVFIECGPGRALMARLGYAPDPELRDVSGEDAVLDGYTIAAEEAEGALEALRAAGLRFDCPEAERFDVRRVPCALTGAAPGSGSAPEARLVARRVSSLLDAAGTSMGRGSFYNTAAEAAEADARIHDAAFAVDRGLYGMLLLLPGVTDHSKQLGLERLLARPRGDAEASLLDGAQEKLLITALARGLPPTRLLKFFGRLRRERVNNARTRKLILRSILASPRLELWATRYRRKLRAALEHALGKRMTGILRSILSKPAADRTAREEAILRAQALRHAEGRDAATVLECLGFVLGLEDGLSLRLLKAYRGAKDKLEAGRGLPYETLEGIRSRYHKDREHAEVLELTAARMTQGQRLTLQRKAEEKGVALAFDPARHDAVRLYLYAFERGLEPGIERALEARARKAAEGLALTGLHAGILVDASGSMAGDARQRLRPMATALAMRDAIAAAAGRVTTVVAGGVVEGRLVRPRGETALAEGLVSLLRSGPDVIFVVSDGYENAPAGRFAEVLDRVRGLGIATPVHQLSPVFAAEASGLRSLAPERAPALPVTRPEAMGVTLFKGLLLSDSRRALGALIDQAAAILALPGAQNEDIKGSTSRALAGAESRR